MSTYYDFYLIKKNKEKNIFEYKGSYTKNKNKFELHRLIGISGSFLPREIRDLGKYTDLSVLDEELINLIKHDDYLYDLFKPQYRLISYKDICAYANNNLIKRAYIESDFYKTLKYQNENIDIYPFLEEYYDSIITPEEYLEQTLINKNILNNIKYVPISWIEPTSIEYVCSQLMNTIEEFYLHEDEDIFVLIIN